MLEIVIPGRQCWDAKDEEFRYEKDTVVRMEHSLSPCLNGNASGMFRFFRTSTN